MEINNINKLITNNKLINYKINKLWKLNKFDSN